MAFRWSDVLWGILLVVVVGLVIWAIVYLTKSKEPAAKKTLSNHRGNGLPPTPPVIKPHPPPLRKIPSMAYHPSMNVHQFWLDHDRNPGYAWRQTADVLQKQTEMRNNLKYGTAFFPTSDYQYLHPWFHKQR